LFDSGLFSGPKSGIKAKVKSLTTTATTTDVDGIGVKLYKVIKYTY